jgi:predicted dienelactone hydrolase
VALLAAACGDDGDVAASTSTQAPAPAPATAVDLREARPYAVTTMQLTLVDTSRPTPESPAGPELPDRTLEVWLHLPDTPGPAPLVVFGHGMAAHPRKFEELHTAWAEAGYAVAAPAFPLSKDTVEGSFTNTHDVPNQPGDVSFVLDELLARSADDTSELAGRFDADRIGASGLSKGGSTTFEVAVNASSRDERFAAAVVMAPAGVTTGPDAAGFVAPDDVPVLLFQGDADPLISLADTEAAYAALNPPRYFVVLLGGGHAGPFEDEADAFEAKVPGHDDLIRASTIAFWDRYLLDVAEASDELVAAADQDGLTTFEHGAG